MTSPAQRLRAALATPRIVVAPGCYDALSTRLVERAVARVQAAGVSYSAAWTASMEMTRFQPWGSGRSPRCSAVISS